MVHVAEDMSRRSGGVPAVVRQLSRRLSAAGLAVHTAYALGDDGELPASVVRHQFAPGRWGRMWRWSRGMRAGLQALATPPGGDKVIFHLHGIWSGIHYVAARVASASKVPFVLSAHGMLEPWLWNCQGLGIWMKKHVYWKTLGFPVLSKATVVHAITPLERDHLQLLFPANRIEVIPNAIEVPVSMACGNGPRSPVVLFLGRIEPKKGVDILIRAFAQAHLGSDWQLQIAGPAWSESYLAELKRLVERLHVQNQVNFLEPVFGNDKAVLLDSAWVMALPSHSEVVGLVNLEAAVHCLPTITTPQTGLYDWESGGGILVEPQVDAVASALSRAAAWSRRERDERGFASRRLVEERYSWHAILPRWLALYESIQEDRA
ncbi:MAG: glycosyltransferase [Sinobacteraceae bacterium]|nr:glycosyltransferase [Nevskiaceae bacterium]